MNIFKLSMFIGLVFTLNSCGNYEEFKEDPSGAFTGLVPGNAISFAEVRDKVLGPRCFKCHGNYSDYEVVKGKVNAILGMVRADAMPKDGPLENNQKIILFSWIQSGAPRDAQAPNPNPGPNPNPVPIPGDPPTGDLDFSKVSTSVFKPHCINCHGSFNDYSVVKSKINIIVDKVRTNQMPLGSTLAPNLKAILFDWAAAGAPQVGTGPLPVPDPIPAPLSPTYESLKTHVLSQKCIACHNPQGRARFLDFSTYEAMSAYGGRLFDFRRPERSDIIKGILDDEEPMPPLGSPFDQVTREEINVLIQWIRLGIPKN
ncbi:MAG: hypothetical protein K9K67_08280 [Bacteriovoracaceae bacterium]|nr:hypothetical protein [Bacteriovoracaceae bacterium]